MIEKFLERYVDFHGKGYNPGEVPEFSKQRVHFIIEIVLNIAAEKAKIKQTENIVYKIFNTDSNEELWEDIEIDATSILNCLL